MKQLWNCHHNNDFSENDDDGLKKSKYTEIVF